MNESTIRASSEPVRRGKRIKEYDFLGITGVDDIRRRYAREQFLKFMAEKFWAEKFGNEKSPATAATVTGLEKITHHDYSTGGAK